MTEAPKMMSVQDMLEMVDEGLFTAFENAINEEAKKRKLTTSQVEMSLAAFLGTLVGESCPTTFEADINCAAYYDVMRSISIAALETDIKETMH